MLFYYTPPKPSEPSEGMNTIELEQACVCARARATVRVHIWSVCICM